MKKLKKGNTDRISGGHIVEFKPKQSNFRTILLMTIIYSLANTYRH